MQGSWDGRGRRQEGIWLGQGSCCPQLSCPCPPWSAGSPRRSEGHQEEREDGDEGGSNTGYKPEESGRGVESMSVHVCVLWQHTLSSTPFPCSHTQRDSVARRPFGPLDIFISTGQSLLREGDPRDAPEQILTSSIRSLWCEGAKALGRLPSVGSAQSTGSAESIDGVGRFWGADGSDSQPDISWLGKSASK